MCKNQARVSTHEGVLTFQPLELPVLMRYVKSLSMEHCSFYSSWSIDLDVGWVGVDEHDLMMSMRKKLLQRYDCRFGSLWLFVVGQYAKSRAMGRLPVLKLNTYRHLNNALEWSQYQTVWLCDWNIVRWVRNQGWEEVVALGTENIGHRRFRARGRRRRVPGISPRAP
jgi:hypothetical protein